MTDSRLGHQGKMVLLEPTGTPDSRLGHQGKMVLLTPSGLPDSRLGHQGIMVLIKRDSSGTYWGMPYK
jgi:predicted hotdog family 3-hydroxylacyl-ACP dehydratase